MKLRDALTSNFAKWLYTAGLRHGATSAGGWIAARGWALGGHVDWVVGGILFVGGASWSAWDKWVRATA